MFSRSPSPLEIEDSPIPLKNIISEVKGFGVRILQKNLTSHLWVYQKQILTRIL